jgi:hypothetical protein
VILSTLVSPGRKRSDVYRVKPHEEPAIHDGLKTVVIAADAR